MLKGLHYYLSKDHNIVYCVSYTSKITTDHQKIIGKLLSAKRIDKSEIYYKTIGSKLSFDSPWSTNVVTIFNRIGIHEIDRIERFYRASINVPFDPITQKVYDSIPNTFDVNILIENVKEISIENIGKYNSQMSLGMDNVDIQYYTKLFRDKLRRNPTDVELFDLAQSNSEHSRHTFFNSKMIIDGNTKEKTLFQLVKEPLKQNKGNSVLAFCDNSSAIEGPSLDMLTVDSTGKYTSNKEQYHPIFTAETHNFPTGISPFHGATTGTGGRIRDVQAAGRGAFPIAGTAGYCVGDFLKDNEECFITYKNAKPKDILIEASNGTSDYGNKYGEPVIQGFTRTHTSIVNGEPREWAKPIMYSGGIGQIHDKDLTKLPPQDGDLIVKVGGPAYRIGLGGGCASSADQNSNIQQRDLDAVQRGDPEMEQKMNRVIRTCAEMPENPIRSIHDQGAGGNGNVLKEIVYPSGGIIDLSHIHLGDVSMTSLEIWCSEYQEQNALLINKKDKNRLKQIAKRENVSIEFIGFVTNDKKIMVRDRESSIVVDLPLDDVFGDMPQKTQYLTTIPYIRTHMTYMVDFREALHQVLSDISVCSKRFLTNKVDRSVTGLIAQQQCVGPFHTPLADVAVVAQSYFSDHGIATAIGEQPIKAFIDAGKSARLSVAEMLTNLMWAQITKFEDIKCAGNWMWPAKHIGEGASMYQAAEALNKILLDLDIAIDGGKDSLSMSAKAINNETQSVINIKCPRSLVMSGYVTCSNINKIVTPDLKPIEDTVLLHLKLSEYTRLGGSIFLYILDQIGNVSPDVEDAQMLRILFQFIQELISSDSILAGHDVSDGGLITTILEMSFAGGVGINITVNTNDIYKFFFSEEPSIVIQVYTSLLTSLYERLDALGIQYEYLGKVTLDHKIIVMNRGNIIIEDNLNSLRDVWESSSFELEKIQANPDCIQEEKYSLLIANHGPQYDVSPSVFNIPKKIGISPKSKGLNHIIDIPKIAIIREEGSNGDREMGAAFYMAGFDVYDVTITDLVLDTIHLDDFRGIAFVGGFSFSDVLGAATGWHACIEYNPDIAKQFYKFFKRPDTFSLGVCNGCQLMTKFGIFGKVTVIKNKSRRFESRYSTVHIQKNNAIMLRGMEGSSLPIWVAHGEGQFNVSCDKMLNSPIRYVDYSGEITESYPHNPNGSPDGIAALVTHNGRHLAMMPHPERTFLPWQLAYNPNGWTKSPWMKMFENAYEWCFQSDQ